MKIELHWRWTRAVAVLLVSNVLPAFGASYDANKSTDVGNLHHGFSLPDLSFPSVPIASGDVTVSLSIIANFASGAEGPTLRIRGGPSQGFFAPSGFTNIFADAGNGCSFPKSGTLTIARDLWNSTRAAGGVGGMEFRLTASSTMPDCVPNQLSELASIGISYQYDPCANCASGLACCSGGTSCVACCVDAQCSGGQHCCSNVCKQCCTGAHCDDGNVCTTDTCAAGICGHSNNSVACNDGVFCNGVDTCSGGVCIHPGTPCGSQLCCESSDTCASQCCTAAICNDADPCTTDTCVSGVCQHPFNTAPCDDGVYCNGADTCLDGSCSLHAGNPCVSGVCCQETDLCQPMLAESPLPEPQACSVTNCQTGDLRDCACLDAAHCVDGRCVCTTNADCKFTAQSATLDTGRCISGRCFVRKNRYLSIVPQDAGVDTALRVKVVTSALVPGLLSTTATYWVGEPAFNVNDGAVYLAISRLQCTPCYYDWRSVETLHIVDDEIVPTDKNTGGSYVETTYVIQAIAIETDTSAASNYSCPLTLPMARWGDVTAGCNTLKQFCHPPDDMVTFTDISAIVDRFENDPPTLGIPMGDISEECPTGFLNFLDISADVSAFQGIRYAASFYPLGSAVPQCGTCGPGGAD